MDIEHTAYIVTRALCKAYLKRDRRNYPIIHNDPQWMMHSGCNRELDTLTAIDSRATVKGFNRAFNEALHY